MTNDSHSTGAAAMGASDAVFAAGPAAQRRSGLERLTVDVMTTDAALQALAPDWDALSARTDRALLFNSSIWVRAWWRSALYRRTHPGSAELRVLAIRENGVLCGVAPLWIENRTMLGRTIRIARFAAEGPSDYGDFLVGGSREVVLQAIVGELMRMRCHVMELREWFGDSHNRELFVTALERAGWRADIAPDATCRIIPAGTAWEAYFQERLSGKRRRELDRQRRQLDVPGPVTTAYFTRVDNVNAAARRFAEVQADRSFGEPRVEEFRDPVFRSFIEEVMHGANERGWLRVAALARGERLIAYYVSFLYGGRYCVYNTAYRHGDGDAGSGRALMRYMLQRMMEEGGGVIDYLRGSEAYKDAWTDGVVQNVSVRASPPGVWGSVAHALVFRLVPALERRPHLLSRSIVVLVNEGWAAVVRRCWRRLRGRAS